MSGQRTDKSGSDADSWDWLTVMDGPEVAGKECIWFGKHEEPWERLDDDGIERCAESVKHIPLPPPTRPEVEAYLDDGYGQRIIE